LRGYLVDTNVTSELRRPKPHGAVLEWLQRTAPAERCVSVVTIGEMQAGIELARLQDPAKAQEIEAWLDHIPELFRVLPMDMACFREWARLMVGKSDQLYEDTMIAATARVHDLIVVTRNVRDFEAFDVRVLNPFEIGVQ
jgi:toxin FitB